MMSQEVSRIRPSWIYIPNIQILRSICEMWRWRHCIGIGLASELYCQGYYTSSCSFDCDSSMSIRQRGIYSPSTTEKKDFILAILPL